LRLNGPLAYRLKLAGIAATAAARYWRWP